MELNFAEKVSVLGTEYSIEIGKGSDPGFRIGHHLGSQGFCDSWDKRIVIRDRTIDVENGLATEEKVRKLMQKVLRHEIVHAFLNESGLRECAKCTASSWALNEETVDWIAHQGPKLLKAWSEAGAL